jgi:threonine/homoserine/homoserine lactone efflux protein
VDLGLAALLDLPLVAGVALAWSLAAPPGPANALIAQEATRRGFAAGWMTGLGAVTGDLTMFLLMRFGVVRVIGGLPWVLVVLGVVGTGLMGWFAWEAWRAARRHGELPDAKGRGSFARSYVTVVTSPFNWAWWLGVGAPLFLGLGWLAAIGFFAGLLLWIAAWTSLARAGAAKVRRFEEIVSYAAAAVLVFFAGVLAVHTARSALALLGAA